MSPLSVVILAAGQGKRMVSRLPKVLHPLGGKPLLAHLIQTVEALAPTAIYIIYGHNGAQVRDALDKFNVVWVEQTQQLGTGHAVLQAMPQISSDQRVLILLGDTPLLTATTLQKLLTEAPIDKIGLVTVEIPDPKGLGRILRDQQGKIIGVVEDKDATSEQKAICEINTGIIVAPAKYLQRWLPALKNSNAQGEYYLPDIIALAVSEGIDITAVNAMSVEEVQGINERAQLAKLERYYQQRIAEQLMQSGVTLKDPARFDTRNCELIIAQDVIVDVNVILEGKVVIGENSYIGPNTILRDVIIGENVQIKANTIIEEAEIANDCVIGPFARIRPGTQLSVNAHIGNFVEIKNSKVAESTKINHLSYIGDATIGKKVNIGAGTITCNYDGAAKYETVIEDEVFVGSATQLIAPVTVGKGATIGAGSTIVKDVPEDTLTLSRSPQITVPDWQRKAKEVK